MSNKLQQIVDFFKMDKLEKMNKGLLISLMCLGILLMILPRFWSNSSKQVPQSTTNLQVSKATTKLSEIQQEEATLSQHAEEILGKIKGVGALEVQVTLEAGTGYESQKNFTNQSQQQALGPKIRGVLVAAEGAADPEIRWQLYQAVQALYDIPLNAIYIAEGMEDGQ